MKIRSLTSWRLLAFGGGVGVRKCVCCEILSRYMCTNNVLKISNREKLNK
jgi:hypothetical protein